MPRNLKGSLVILSMFKVDSPFSFDFFPVPLEALFYNLGTLYQVQNFSPKDLNVMIAHLQDQRQPQP